MKSDLQVTAENVGGIESASITVSEGTTVLSGENTTNRSSLLSAIQAALGSNKPTIRTGADNGKVSLETPDKTYERTVTATQSGSEWSGEGFFDDPNVLQIFSILTRENPLRKNVQAGNNLYDLIMAPVDTNEIEEKITELKSERREITEKINSRKDKQQEIASLKQDKEEKQEELTELQDRLSEVNAEIDKIDEQNIQSDVLERSRDLNEKLKDLNAEQKETNADIERVETRIEARKTELNELKSGDDANIESLRADVDEINSKLSEKDAKIDSLQQDKRVLSPLQQFLSQINDNDNVQMEDFSRVISTYIPDEKLEDIHNTETVGNDDNSIITDVLMQETDDIRNDQQPCIICGGNLSTKYEPLLKTVNLALSNIRNLIDDIQSETDTLRDDKTKIQDEIRNLNENQARITKLEGEIEELQAEKQELENELKSITEELADVKEESESIEDEIVDQTESKIGKLKDLGSEQTELEIDIENAEDRIESIDESIASLKDEIDSIESLESEQLPAIKEEIKSLRNRVKEKESAVVEEFNTAMETLIDNLGYENIERVWIEKQEKEQKQGRKTVSKPIFNLNIGREVDGAVQTDTIDNLSESESVIISLMFAIAGYITHDINDKVPFILMDSVEMIDANRLDSLLEYIEEHTDYLIVTALPEDTSVIETGDVVTMKG